ncbi:hypothetical protein BD413DRAFT_485798 [Trametes elegans]|nr:hypothetical protein BD413DRAFT_485798 [Trametes elegans]
MLGPISLTCKWLREVCKPIMFKRCKVVGSKLDHFYHPTFIPRSLWPHVQCIVISGPFNRNDVVTYYDEYEGSTPGAMEYEAICFANALRTGELVREALSSMPLLQIVEICTLERIDPALIGVSWYILRAILSSPQLRRFVCFGRLCNPNDSLPEEATFTTTAPLEEIVYSHSSFDALPVIIPMERHFLELFLPHAASTLQNVVLPVGAAPLEAMSLCDWPALHRLVLRGERPVCSKPSRQPLVAVLGRMPKLRVLALLWAEPANSDPEPIWPPSFNAEYEWPELEDLTVMHPRPDDKLYAHLGPSLRELALRCWPRYYKHQRGYNYFMHQDGAEVHWASPLLLSSAMLRILRSSEASSLTHLELEYRADDSDQDLLDHIASAFPHLIVLRIHRYRKCDTSVVPVADIAHSLSSLRELRMLMLHLDFHDLPNVDAMNIEVWDPEIRSRNEEEVTTSWATLVAAADILARGLSPSVEHVCILWPPIDSVPKWRVFNIFRPSGEAGEGEDVRVWQRPYTYGDSLYDYECVPKLSL